VLELEQRYCSWLQAPSRHSSSCAVPSGPATPITGTSPLPSSFLDGSPHGHNGAAAPRAYHLQQGRRPTRHPASVSLSGRSTALRSGEQHLHSIACDVTQRAHHRRGSTASSLDHRASATTTTAALASSSIPLSMTSLHYLQPTHDIHNNASPRNSTPIHVPGSLIRTGSSSIEHAMVREP